MKAPWTTERTVGTVVNAVVFAAGIAVVIFAAAFVSPASARQTTFATESGFVQFDSRMPLHEFSGTSEQLVGQINLADSTVDFFVDLATLDTGNGKRDKDMRSTLEVDKYPFAEYFGKLVTRFDPTSSAMQPATTRGTFTVHGVSREVEVSGTLQRTDDGLHLVAAFEVNLEDHDIRPPRILMLKVRDVQEVSIDVNLTPTGG